MQMAFVVLWLVVVAFRFLLRLLLFSQVAVALDAAVPRPPHCPRHRSYSGDYEDPVTKKTQDYFMHVVSSGQREHPQFRLNRFATQFLLKNLQECSHPEALMYKIFERSIREACERTTYLDGSGRRQRAGVSRISI